MRDSGFDAGLDGGASGDAGFDGNVLEVDAGLDAGSDSGADAAIADAGFDSGVDGGAIDAGADAGLDAGVDAGAGLDAGSDAGADAGTDAGLVVTDGGSGSDSGTGPDVDAGIDGGFCSPSFDAGPPQDGGTCAGQEDFTPCGPEGSNLFCLAGSCVSCICGIESTPAACSDGMDNDCNGHTDCADPGCDGIGCALGRICISQLCQPSPCDPLNQNCATQPTPFGCYPVADGGFTCKGSGFGGPGDPCLDDSSCQPGTACFVCTNLDGGSACRTLCDPFTGSQCLSTTSCTADGTVGVCCE